MVFVLVVLMLATVAVAAEFGRRAVAGRHFENDLRVAVDGSVAQTA